MYADRKDAGKTLSKELRAKKITNGMVMAIPRGGVVPGRIISEDLQVPLDLIIPRKIGAPQNPEMAVGAVAQDGSAVYDDHLLSLLGLAPEDLETEKDNQVREIRRRMMHYRGSEKYPDYTGREIILVDDGIATGATMLAAVRSLESMFKLSRLLIAVPVGPPETIVRLSGEVDEVICPLQPENFGAVGQFYQEFEQVEDGQVISSMKTAGEN